MGNTNSERSGAGDKANRRESRGAKDSTRPKLLLDSTDDGDLFQTDDVKVNREDESRFWYLLFWIKQID